MEVENNENEQDQSEAGDKECKRNIAILYV